MSKVEKYITEKNVKNVSIATEEKNGHKFLAISMSINGKSSVWRFGVSKAKMLIDNYDVMNKSYEDFDDTIGVWTYTLEMKSAKFEAKPMKLNANHLATLYLNKGDIIEFIKSNTVSRPKKCITKPEMVTMANGFDTVTYLVLPCFEKTENDEGDGLVGWFISPKKARQITTYAFDGCMEDTAEAHLKEHPDEDLVWHAKRISGEEYEVVFKPEMVRAYVTYRKDIEKFERSSRV